MAEVLSQIKAKYGVYAITGNHDFTVAQKEDIYEYIKSAGLIFLKTPQFGC